MHIIVTGAGGFLGRRVIDALLHPGPAPGLGPFDGVRAADLLPAAFDDPRVAAFTGDIADPGFVADLVGAGCSGVIHLASVVSAQAEADFDLSHRVNIDGTRTLLEQVRARCPGVPFVFASSVAAFGGDLPVLVPDDRAVVPQSTYGVHKAMGELMVHGYTRKGWARGRALRLPTIVVRPGRPNAAASSFASGIIREPLAGQPAICPVPTDTPLWVSSPEMATRNLLRALSPAVPAPPLGTAWNLPGLTVTVAQMLNALEAEAGADVRRLVSVAPDPDILRIVGSWPAGFDAARARAAGFEADTSFADIIRQHIAAMARQG